jgi:hypothetical protein
MEKYYGQVAKLDYEFRLIKTTVTDLVDQSSNQLKFITQA